MEGIIKNPASVASTDAFSRNPNQSTISIIEKIKQAYGRNEQEGAAAFAALKTQNVEIAHKIYHLTWERFCNQNPSPNDFGECLFNDRPTTVSPITAKEKQEILDLYAQSLTNNEPLSNGANHLPREDKSKVGSQLPTVAQNRRRYIVLLLAVISCIFAKFLLKNRFFGRL